MKNIITFILLWGVSIIFCSAVDIELSKEGPCITPPPQTVNFNSAAFLDASVSLFNPLMSKYALYRSTEDLIGNEKFKNITEDEITNKSCLTFSADTETSYYVRGFKGLEQRYELNPEAKISLQFRIKGQDDSSGWDESFITKTGEDYFVAVDCWATGQKSFTVNSKQMALGTKDMTEIVEHVKSMGFKSEYFSELNYDYCFI